MTGHLLRNVHKVEDLPKFFGQLDYDPDYCPIGDNTVIVARWKSFLIVAAADREPARVAIRLCATFARSTTHVLAVGLDAPSRMVFAVPRMTEIGTSRLLNIDLSNPTADALALLDRLRPGSSRTVLQHALRIDELLASETVGERFYAKFKVIHTSMAEAIPGKIPDTDRQMIALLALIRLLFLYFVQAKGWLAGKSDYLRSGLDDMLGRQRHFQKQFLNPLYFETLNQPLSKRTGNPTFDNVPYLNGGLFDRHPIEHKWKNTEIDNEVWRTTFDELFERFRFCVKEAHEVDTIAPDMLGRVFERIMAPDVRHASGTFYTPENIVRQIVDATLETSLAHFGGISSDHARRVLAGELDQKVDSKTTSALCAMRVLDPAVGSGAFLLVALESLTRARLALTPTPHPPGRITSLRRNILKYNLFGVDLNTTAVRLAELRLWLSVIADDPTTDIKRIEPLPNLDGFVRQGNSLFDPIGAARTSCNFIRIPKIVVTAVKRERQSLFAARGQERKHAVARLRKAELHAAESALTTSIESVSAAMRDLVSEARSKDLFGKRTGFRTSRGTTYGRYRVIRNASRKALTAVREGTIPFFSYDVHAPEIMADGGFTAVVGNPPWVRAERLKTGDRDRLKDRFSWWRGSGKTGFQHLPDLSIAFTERALEITRPGGAIGFLLPSKLATAGYAERARRHLSRHVSLAYLHRLPDNEAARFGATTYPLVVVAKKEKPGPKHSVRLRFDNDERVSQKRLQHTGPWILVATDVHDALRAFLRAGTPLGQVSPAILGVKTGANSIFIGILKSRTRDSVTLHLDDGEHTFASDEVRPVIMGRDVSRFRLTPKKLIVWTHAKDGRPLPKLSPRATVYFRARHRRLAKRADYIGGPMWTVYRTSATTRSDCVIWSDIVRKPAAAVLSETQYPNAIPLNSCYVACAPNNETAFVLTAVMNSTWTTALLTLCGDEARGGYRRMNARVANDVPIPPVNQTWPTLVTMSRSAHHDKNFNQTELDEAVADCFGLSESTRRALAGVCNRDRR